MIKVKVQTNNKRRFTIPVPYVFLHIFRSFISTEFLWKQINKQINQHSKVKANPNISLDSKIIKHYLSPVIDELKNHKGLIIVDVQLKDGTKVMIKT